MLGVLLKSRGGTGFRPDTERTGVLKQGATVVGKWGNRGGPTTTEKGRDAQGEFDDPTGSRQGAGPDKGSRQDPGRWGWGSRYRRGRGPDWRLRRGDGSHRPR